MHRGLGFINCLLATGLVCFALLFGSQSYAQFSIKKDSLLSNIRAGKTSSDIENLVSSYEQLGLIYDRQGLLDSARIFYEQALVVIGKGHEQWHTSFYNRLAANYWNDRNLAQAHFYSLKAKENASKYNQELYLADALVMLALCHYQEGQYQDAIQANLQALDVYQNKKAYYNKATTHLNLGIVYINSSLYNRAIEHLIVAVDIFDELDRRTSMSYTYNSIAEAYLKNDQRDKALEFYNKALTLSSENNDSLVIAGTLNNIGEVYQELGSLSIALDYLERSLLIKELLGDKERIALTLENIGELHFRLNDQIKAEEVYLTALDYSEQAGDKLTISNLSNKLSELYLSQRNFTKAIKYLKEARTLSEEMQTLEVLRKNYELTSALHEKLGNSQQALSYYKKQAVLSDSILNREKQRALTEMQVKYETEQKEKDIAVLNEKAEVQEELLDQQQVSIYALIGAAVLLFLLAFLAYNRYRLKNRANAHIRHLMDELNHRVKNNLQVISSLLKIQSYDVDSELARDVMLESRNRVGAMALIHQRLYQKDGVSAIDMGEYISDLVKNLGSAFGYSEKNLQLNIKTHDIHLDVDSSIPIGLIINELTCNAFKYAFSPERNNELDITLEEKDRTLLLSVQDNGAGMSPKEGSEESFGLSLIKSLAKELNAELEFDWTSGTKVTLVIKRYKIPDKKMQQLLKAV